MINIYGNDIFCISSYIYSLLNGHSLIFWEKNLDQKKLITTCKKKVQGGVFAVYGWKNPYIEMKKCNGFSFKQKQQQQQQ